MLLKTCFFIYGPSRDRRPCGRLRASHGPHPACVPVRRPLPAGAKTRAAPLWRTAKIVARTCPASRATKPIARTCPAPRRATLVARMCPAPRRVTLVARKCPAPRRPHSLHVRALLLERPSSLRTCPPQIDRSSSLRVHAPLIERPSSSRVRALLIERPRQATDRALGEPAPRSARTHRASGDLDKHRDASGGTDRSHQERNHPRGSRNVGPRRTHRRLFRSREIFVQTRAGPTRAVAPAGRGRRTGTQAGWRPWLARRRPHARRSRERP